jgi:hypothetical protein
MALLDRDPGAAILKLSGKTGEFKFLCPAEMQGVYGHSNEYEAQSVVRSGNLFVSESPTMLWHGGKDSEVTLELKLVAGASIDIDTPGELMDTMTKLAGLCQAAEGSTVPQEPPEVVKLQIGTWFARKALVMSGTFGFGRPWDPGTGLPYVGFVNFSLQWVYDQLPNASSFRFDRG